MTEQNNNTTPEVVQDALPHPEAFTIIKDDEMNHPIFQDLKEEAKEEKVESWLDMSKEEFGEKVAKGEADLTEMGVLAEEMAKHAKPQKPLHYVTKNHDPNRHQRRTKKGQEEYQKLQVNKARNELFSGPEEGENVDWKAIEDLYATNKLAFTPIFHFIKYFRESGILQYVHPDDAEALKDNITILNKDVKAALEELEAIHDQHKEKSGPVQFSDLQLYMVVTNMYQSFFQGFQGYILPTYEHLADIIRKAECVKTIAENPEAAQKVINERNAELAKAEAESISDAEVIEEIPNKEVNE